MSAAGVAVLAVCIAWSLFLRPTPATLSNGPGPGFYAVPLEPLATLSLRGGHQTLPPAGHPIPTTTYRVDWVATCEASARFQGVDLFDTVTDGLTGERLVTITASIPDTRFQTTHCDDDDTVDVWLSRP